VADLTTINNILKDDYKDLVDQLNEDCWLLPQITQTSDNVVGRRAYHTIHTTRSRGIGSRAELETLPAAGAQGYSVVPVPLRYHYGRLQLSGQLIAQASTDRGAFADGMDSEMQSLKNDVVRDRCRQVWGTSNGVIAQCGVTTAANIVVLATTTTLGQMRQLWFDGGMVVDIGTVASRTSRLSACHTAAYPSASARCTYPIASRIGCASCR
jgi:hypothetical protein